MAYAQPAIYNCTHCGGIGPAPTHRATTCPWWGAGRLAVCGAVQAAREVMTDPQNGRGADVSHLRGLLAGLLTVIDQAAAGKLVEP